MKTASAPGKIILSGEYAVVFGHRGIAIPSSLLATVSYEESDTPLEIHWPNVHSHWIAYAEEIAKLLNVSTGTLSIDHQVPLGKGMGSSTSLIVAMAKCLIREDREKALSIENILAPNNSGIDFSVIWNNAAILFKKGEDPQIIDVPPLPNTALLIDTGTPDQQTAELVAWVQDRETELQEPLNAIGNCTERILNGDALPSIFTDHHHAQVALGVVPEGAQKLITEIESLGGAAKTLGAGSRTGGGGMILALNIQKEQIPLDYPVLSLNT